MLVHMARDQQTMSENVMRFTRGVHEAVMNLSFEKFAANQVETLTANNLEKTTLMIWQKSYTAWEQLKIDL